MESKEFAKLILEAQKLHEESWNKKEGKYKLSQEEAADQACVKLGISAEWAFVIYLLNYSTWNDIQGWAENQA